MSLSKQESSEFEKHMAAAKELHDKMPHDFHDVVGKHAEHLTTYINQTVRNGTKPTTKGLRAHIAARHQKYIDAVSTPSAKASKTEKMNADLAHHDANETHFANALKIHHHIQAAKDILVNGLNKASKQHNPLEHHINGKETHPEGYVAHHNGQSIKLVNRGEFSRANFAATKAWKSGQS
jgi:hypothetical protein